jgi:16S rRNA (guanine527-N7)-methyltransferase
MNRAALASEAAAFGLELDAYQLERFAEYERLLLEWNQRFNLTAITEPDEIRRRHFLDCLSCAIVTKDLGRKRLVDVGSGAGFPGLPLKILFPTLELTLVESVAKKAGFLKTASAALNLEQVEVVGERAELVGQQPAYRERYDWAVARAVSGMGVLAEYLLPLCRLGGRMLAMKAADASEECASAARAIRLLGGGEPQLTPIHLPGIEPRRFLVIIPKEAPTPPAYPRRPGLPAKRPLV